MIELKLYNGAVVDSSNKLYPIYDIKLVDKVSVIIGLSGSGKTYLIDSLKEADNNGHSLWSYNCDVPVRVLGMDNAKDLDLILTNINNHLIVCDEDLVNYIRQNSKLKLIKKSENYFLLCDRTSMIKFDVNVNSVYKLKYRNYNGEKVYDIIKAFNLKDTIQSKGDISDIKFLVTEDSESGLIFWKNILSKVVVPKFKEHGNGEVFREIRYLLRNYTGKVLVILDYDHGAIMMRKILNHPRIDKSRVVFMSLESFEEVICNSEFILSKYPKLKDIVINYKNYINCSYRSTGKYFSAILFMNIKVLSPLKQPGDKNAYKFYTKGMKNFKECFINNCCEFGKSECKLYYEGDKKRAMLANKFEIYRKFI